LQPDTDVALLGGSCRGAHKAALATLEGRHCTAVDTALAREEDDGPSLAETAPGEVSRHAGKPHATTRHNGAMTCEKRFVELEWRMGSIPISVAHHFGYSKKRHTRRRLDIGGGILL
jgi:hypothetical protein